MVPAVEGFYQIFSRESMGHMTIVAGGCCVMAGPEPGIIMLLHHMAVDAGLGIIVSMVTVGGGCWAIESTFEEIE